MTFARNQAEHAERRAAEKALNMRVNSLPSRAISTAVIGRCDGAGAAVPKEPEPVRDESYRRWVATLPCFECRVEGFSNAAHPNSGKAKGVKLGDDECFPLCVDRPGVEGCHPKFDQYKLVKRSGMPEYERAALEWTQQQER